MQGKYNFIKIQKIIIRDFSLYKKGGETFEVNESINDGVYCLAGANGLGKTTFLNAVNYGLTGIVLQPNKEVFSPSEIITYNKSYTERYFKGRVSVKDEKKAEIEITFIINNKYFRIIRSFFQREELRLLEIYQLDNETKISLIADAKQNPIELNRVYQTKLSEEIGFNNFDYFIFYQLYIFTFDENRRVIFWDNRASSQALAIAFNSTPKDADKFLELTRKMEKYESNGRNAKWQAKQIEDIIKELSQKTKKRRTADLHKLEQKFKKLYNDLEEAENVHNNIKVEFDTLLREQSYLNSEIIQLKTEHAKLFTQYSTPRSKLLQSPYVQNSIKRQECCLCGSHGSFIADKIEKGVYKDTCPLCSTILVESSDKESSRLLYLIERNDNKIVTKNLTLENITSEIEGKKIELEKIEYEFNTAKKKYSEFIEDNPDITFTKTGNESIDILVQQHKEQYTSLINKSRNEYRKRDTLKPEREKLLKKINTAYKEAEIVFVPIFKKLAKSFIGIELNIQPEKSNKGVKLVLDMNGTSRTESFQLSESQRYFLDIALRMSLAIFLSKKGNEATLLIDTPEGSLDIAYESRVGNMFSDFVLYYHQNLIITANINASQLLVTLAERCRKDRMKFRRMLEWTSPSEIQKDGEHLFKKIYQSIEATLKK